MAFTFTDEERVRQIVKAELKEQLRFVPSKDLFLEKMDELMGEVKGVREEFAAHSGMHQDIDDRLEEHEKQINVVNKKLNISY